MLNKLLLIKKIIQPTARHQMWYALHEQVKYPDLDMELSFPAFSKKTEFYLIFFCLLFVGDFFRTDSVVLNQY